MLKLMKQFNSLLKRYADAYKFYSDDKISIGDKVKQNDRMIRLHEDIINIGIQINAEGYKISEEEYEHGFRQIEYLERYKLI